MLTSNKGEDFQRQANYLLKRIPLLGLPQQVAYRSTGKSVTSGEANYLSL